MSTAAIPVHVALVDMSGEIPAPELAEVAGALNEQVQADVAPAWKIAATVGAYPEPPVGTWRIELHRTIPQKGAAGIHLDDHGQPYSLIALSDGEWTVSTSHELIEMLIDPLAGRLHTAKLLDGWDGPAAPARVRYLMEPCDPCERITYEVGGVRVSDFVLPRFYRSTGATDSDYSHTGAIKQPLEILDGGYISFFDPDPKSRELYQRFVEGGKNEDVGGRLEEEGPEAGIRMSLRGAADRQAQAHRASAQPDVA
jgi:hypothetical protein